MSNDNISCRIKRSDRPCIVCSGHMDLIEAHPRRFNFFSAALLPYMCGGAEGVDCLDCPKCGFKTTTADYQYLHMCKKERQTGAGGSIIPGNGRRSSSNSNSNSNNNSNRIRGENTRTTCSHCQASLESSSWQFCPSCGKKCASSSSTTSGTTTTVKKNEQNNNQSSDGIIKDSIERNDTISASNSCSSSSRSNSNSISNSNSRGSGGIVRMVTPPKRTSTDDYSSPVQMQY